MQEKYSYCMETEMSAILDTYSLFFMSAMLGLV